MWAVVSLIIHLPLWLLKLPFSIFNWINKKINPTDKIQVRLPKQTLTLVQLQEHPRNWSFGKTKNGKDVISAACKLMVTNITKGSMQIASVYMKKPASTDSIFMVKSPFTEAFGRSAILSRQATEVIADFVLRTSVCKEGKNLTGDVIVVDQLGNNHIVKVVFRPFPEV